MGCTSLLQLLCASRERELSQRSILSSASEASGVEDEFLESNLQLLSLFSFWIYCQYTYYQGELAFTPLSFSVLMSLPCSTASRFYSIFPLPFSGDALHIRVTFPLFVSLNFLSSKKKNRILIFNCCTTCSVSIHFYLMRTNQQNPALLWAMDNS